MLFAQALRYCMTILGPCQPRSQTPIKIYSSYALNVWHVLSSFFIWVYYNLNYISQHALGVAEAPERYYLIAIVPAPVFEAIFLAINKQQVFDIFTDYENLANERKENHKAQAILKIEKFFQKFLKFLQIYLSLLPVEYFLIVIIVSYFNWRRGVPIEQWELLLPTLQMVDQSSYLDFVINSLAALIVTCYNVFVYFIHTCFYIFMCMYLRAFLSDWKQSVKECDKLKLDSPLSTERIVIKRKLCDAVIYHMKIINLMDKGVNVMSGSLFVDSLIAAVVAATCMTIMSEAKTLDRGVIIGINGGLSCICTMYLKCYLADELSTNCQHLSMAIYELQWYNYSLNLHKYLVLIMIRSQQPKYFHGLSLVPITMRFFAQIMNTSVSYFLMFRNLKNA